MSATSDLPRATSAATPIDLPPAAPILPPTSPRAEPKIPASAATIAPIDHGFVDAQARLVDGASSPQAKPLPTPSSPSPAGTPAPSDWLFELALASKKLDALEASRKALASLHRSLERNGVLDPDTLGEILGISKELKRREYRPRKDIEILMLDHPLAAWIEATPGIGGLGVGRLIAALGPGGVTYNAAHGRERRGCGELLQFCGHGDPERSRLRRGQKIAYSPTAKMRTYLIAESAYRNHDGPYRAIYDAAQAKYEGAVHSQPCSRCTKRGQSAAAVGSPLSPLHRKARALRIVGREILKDMWREMTALP